MKHMYKKVYLLVIALLLIPTTSQAELDLNLPAYDPNDYNLPDFNAPSPVATQSISPVDLTKQLRRYRNALHIIEDPEIMTWVQSLGLKVARASGNTQPLFFVLTDNAEINASASKYGIIVINSGLVLHAESESELAAVMAHEVAHVTQKHILRMEANNRKRMLQTGAAILAGLAAGSASGTDMGGAVVSAGMAASIHQQLSFNRDMESEADRIGLKTLVAAGFKPQGMPSYLERLDRLSNQEYAQLTRYLQSHPLSIDRVSDTRTRANRYGNRGRESIDFTYAREKIRHYVDSRGSQYVSNSQQAAIQKYSQAVLQLKQNRPANVEKLIAKNSRHLPEILLLAEAFNRQNKYTQSLQLLRPFAARYANHEAFAIFLAQAYLGQGNKQQAWQTINAVKTSELTTLRFYEEKQRLAAANGMQAQVFLAAAERTMRLGQYHHAKIQLDKAKMMQDANQHDLRKIHGLLNDLELYQN